MAAQDPHTHHLSQELMLVHRCETPLHVTPLPRELTHSSRIPVLIKRTGQGFRPLSLREFAHCCMVPLKIKRATGEQAGAASTARVSEYGKPTLGFSKQSSSTPGTKAAHSPEGVQKNTSIPGSNQDLTKPGCTHSRTSKSSVKKSKGLQCPCQAQSCVRKAQDPLRPSCSNCGTQISRPRPCHLPEPNS